MIQTQNPNDEVLICIDCGEEFIFTDNDKKFYAEKGFSKPKRCKADRIKNKERRLQGGGNNGNSNQ